MSKSEYIHVRVAPWEKGHITMEAKRAGRSVSDYVRRAAMNQEVIETSPLKEIMIELRRQGNNLNQLIVMARQGRISYVDFKPFMEVYQAAWQTLNSLLSHGA